MKNRIVSFSGVLLAIVLSMHCGEDGANDVVGHNNTNIAELDDVTITMIKQRFKIAYGHTSHGSQIISGMTALMEQDSRFSFSEDGTDGSLSIHDRTPGGDLGNPDRTTWAERTRELLNEADNDRNLIMWSWCGQVSSATEEDINTYLNLMDELEQDFPEVTFVYMTGHLDGTGLEGNLHQRNEQIRTFCKEHSKVLFDFADIESYDPDGNYYLDKAANDNCDYDSDLDGSRESNWAIQYCNANEGACSSVSCAHSQSLNCDMKARAFWMLLAELLK